MSSENVIGSDTERLQILLKIAREQHYSLDDLDDWTRDLHWEEFQDWSEIFLRTKGKQVGDSQSQLQAETVQPHREFANDNAD